MQLSSRLTGVVHRENKQRVLQVKYSLFDLGFIIILA